MWGVLWRRGSFKMAPGCLVCLHPYTGRQGSKHGECVGAEFSYLPGKYKAIWAGKETRRLWGVCGVKITVESWCGSEILSVFVHCTRTFRKTNVLMPGNNNALESVLRIHPHSRSGPPLPPSPLSQRCGYNWSGIEFLVLLCIMLRILGLGLIWDCPEERVKLGL